MAIAPLPSSQHREEVTTRYALAVDLGQSNDPTAVAVLEHRKHQHVHIKGRITQAGETFDVRYLRRLPLGLSYVEQVGEVSRLVGRPPLNDQCLFAIDETGVGRAVGDFFDQVGVSPTRITITGGTAVTNVGPRRFHVPKGILVSLLDARLHTGELRFAANLTEASAMANELRDFRRHVSAAGRFSFEARAGQHDDLVLSVAIGIWVLTQPKAPRAAVGVYASTPAPP